MGANGVVHFELGDFRNTNFRCKSALVCVGCVIPSASQGVKLSPKYALFVPRLQAGKVTDAV